MKPFVFQRFTVHQTKEVFRVGTDAVLIGALAAVHGPRILEVGTGTGIISLMMAQRNAECIITAIDINTEAVELAKLNFANSPFAARLSAIECDFKTFDGEKFSQIITNPPYFEPNLSQKDVAARQTVELNFGELIQRSASLLLPDGRLSVIVPASAAEGFVDLCEKEGMFLVRKVDVHGIAGGPLKRRVLEFSPKRSAGIAYETLTVEKVPRVFTDDYLALTKNFHVFSKA